MAVEPRQVEGVVVGSRRLVELLDAVVVRVAVLEYLNRIRWFSQSNGLYFVSICLQQILSKQGASVGEFVGAGWRSRLHNSSIRRSCH